MNENQKIYFKILSLKFYDNLFLNQRIFWDNSSFKSLNKDFEKIILQNGLALAANENYKKYENIEQLQKYIKLSRSKNFFIYNPLSAKYHKLNCKMGLKSKKKTYLTQNELPPNAIPCKYCFHENNTPISSIKNDAKFSESIISLGYVKIIQSLSFDILKPSNSCTSKMCISLKNEIDNAKTSIDIAVYEFDNQPEILSALINAKNRGVKIQAVTDDSKISALNDNTFLNLKKVTNNIYTDLNCKKNVNRLMHNKFIIFDNQKVWTGSTNITNTGITGFNTNTVILLNSKEIAEKYKSEFENFKNDKYHFLKQSDYHNNFTLNNSKINVFFSPQDKPVTTQIIPEIIKAKKYIYIPAFYFTHNELANQLINAHKRGVDVKVIIDATSAANKYSKHKILRQNAVSVKTENFAGKMHMKTIIIDDKTAFLGSMNFTKSGDVYNDENCIKIENTEIAKSLKKDFLLMWNKIPNDYLYKDPKAESLESTGSCYDGIDNDFDGWVDEKDSGCKII